MTIEKIESFSLSDLDNLCQATHDAIVEGIGFHWASPPSREVLESYWKGVLLVPERTLLVAKLDGVVAGSAQLVRPSRNRQLSSFMGVLEAQFVAPWARGHGLARQLLSGVEREARDHGLAVLRLDVRETQAAAIALYEAQGYVRWGILPKYEQVGDAIVAGHFFYKEL